jgi:hypothetical protein
MTIAVLPCVNQKRQDKNQHQKPIVNLVQPSAEMPERPLRWCSHLVLAALDSNPKHEKPCHLLVQLLRRATLALVFDSFREPLSKRQFIQIE